MNVKTLQLVFYVIFLAGVTVLFFFIAAPYIGAIFLALITSVLFKSLNERALREFSGRKNLAAFISTLFVIAIITIPLVVVGNLVFHESTQFYQNSRDSVSNYSFGPVAEKIGSFIEQRFPGLNIDTDRFSNIGPYVERGFTWFSSNLSSFFSSAVRITLSAFLYVLCLFYLFRDGNMLTRNVLDWSPLFDTHDKLILNKISTVINSVLRGQLLVGIIQGLLTGIGFWIFGVPSPVIWGVVAAIASLIPAIGTSLVNIPAIIYLLLNGHIGQAIGLTIWAVVAVGLVDNILGPYFINRGAKIHPFLILISVLGGLSLFGPIGFIAGPVALSLLFALLELYPVIMKSVDGKKSSETSTTEGR